MAKRLTLQASGNSYFKGYKCSHCGSTQVIASNSQTPHCAYCGEDLDSGTPVSRAELTASPEKALAYVKCVSCDTVYAADSEESAEELAASKYCPDCAGDSLIACDKDGNALPQPEDPDIADDDAEDPIEGESTELNAGEGCEGKECDKEDCDEDAPIDLDENIVNSGDDTYSEMDASTYEDLQWSALATNDGEDTAMIASSIKTGNPVALFKRTNAPSAMQPLFAQPLFVSAFNEVAADKGLATAIKNFGGSYFSAKVLTAADIEAAALSNMEQTAIPRLIDCCQMAVEGGVKGIYQDVYASMQKSIVNELIASGVDSTRANDAVSNTFSIHGSELFGTIIAKAMELFSKNDEARLEAKALITNASPASHTAMNEQAEIRARMETPTPNFGILNITASADNEGDIKSLRKQLF